MEREKLVLLVRDPDERWDVEGIAVLTRERLLEIFPGTGEHLIVERALLVRHPYLHPKFARVLLPTSNLYTALREEAELELFAALMRLGATAVELEQMTDENERSRTAGSGDVSAVGAKVKGSFESKDSIKETVNKRLLIQFDPQAKVDIEGLEEREFFDQLVFQKDNITLKALFHEIKAGRVCKEFRLEFKHTIDRAHALEVDISAAYLNLFKVNLNFQQEYEKNRVERSSMVAKFG